VFTTDSFQALGTDSGSKPGKEYVVTLPAKRQIEVASVLVPVGELGANATARWAVEGKIGDEAIGAMVHEMNVLYIIADMKLPAVGSKEEVEQGAPPATTKSPSSHMVAIAAAAGVAVICHPVLVDLAPKAASSGGLRLATIAR